jgi:phycocyanobilin lyase beta subunit
MTTSTTVQDLIRSVERADSAAGMLTAVTALAAAREPAAIEPLIDVLGYNNPGAAVAAVDGLVALGKVAVPHLLARLDGYNYGARAWATRALALIGDPRGLEHLLDAAENDFSFSVRRGAARGLGAIVWADLEESAVEEARESVFGTLERIFRGDPEWVVRYAATVALEGLALAATGFRGRTIELFGKAPSEERDLVVRLRVVRARERLVNA